MILKIINNLNIVFLAIAIISGFAMLGYLKSKGIARSRIFTLNPLILSEYVRITKKETGKIGIWFLLFVISIGLLIVFGLTELVVNFVGIPN